MLGTLLIVWGFGTLFGAIALGKWEEHCSKPKEEMEEIPAPQKIPLAVWLLLFFIISLILAWCLDTFIIQ